MSRRCDLTGIGQQSGNRVSHSNRKTRRTFQPNLQKVSLLSDALGGAISMRVTAATLRTIDHNGGLDSFLVTTADANLTPIAVTLKRRIKKAMKAA